MAASKQIPNLLTLSNLACGCLGIASLMLNNLPAGALFILLAAVFDYLDGMAARLLKAGSELGKQLDSLADVVSFGVLPGMIMYRIMLQSVRLQYPGTEWISFIPFIAVVIPLASALRLAKFNIDSRQHHHFLGLPTPASALFFTSFPFILFYHGHGIFTPPIHFLSFLFDPFLLACICLLISLLMISEIPIFSLKFQSFSWKENHYHWIFFLLLIPCLLVFRLGAGLLIIPLYVILSVVFRASFHPAGAERHV
ncbi:MAG TPA: CDP-diacylglycerol--serine O-phosphatidyltransferase [Bacteroidales bacterium]|nr:CDP-diacylglycerol--serine O-phosphatidyltransferase [Bacteroidales bacterium]HSA42835.1 CDP-diacylglycerol--serine O-phosphatidyltransferase [Bacteroidales bacterium]